MSRRRLKIVPLFLVLALLAGGGYYAWTKYLSPGHGTMRRMAAEPASEGSPLAFTEPPPDAVPVDKPNFDTSRSDNAKARADVLERIDRMPNLSPAQKTKLTQSVDKARGMGCVLLIPFEGGKTTLDSKQGDLLLKATKTASIQKLVEDPTLVLVVLGYSDKKGDPKQNLKVSIDRAESVQSALKDRCNILNVIYSVGMGGSDLMDANAAAKNRLVEVWAVFP